MISERNEQSATVKNIRITRKCYFCNNKDLYVFLLIF